MAGVAERFIREPAAESVREYETRVNTLAAIYVVLFVSAATGLVILALRGKYFVTLSQRSNVETLTLAFFLIFFAYVALLSWRGVAGGLRVAYFQLRAATTRDRHALEQVWQHALGPCERAKTVALNVVLDIEGAPNEPFSLRIEDEFGSLGSLEVEGARLVQHLSAGHGSVNLFVFFVHQLNKLVPSKQSADIVEWDDIDDEETKKYSSLVSFAQALERRLEADLWPHIHLTPDQCRHLEEILSGVCPALRRELFLPDWEYTAEHKVPIIPEPLALATLSRQERRADPVATMGLAAAVVIGAVVVLSVLVVFPPWVPGS